MFKFHNENMNSRSTDEVLKGVVEKTFILVIFTFIINFLIDFCELLTANEQACSNFTMKT